MPGNAGYTILMFHILKEWHHLRDLSRSHSDRGGAKDLATFSLRFDFSYFHILLGRGKPCPQMLFSQHFFFRPLLHFPSLFPVKLSLQALLQFLQNVRCVQVSKAYNSAEITRPGYIGAQTFDPLRLERDAYRSRWSSVSLRLVLLLSVQF